MPSTSGLDTDESPANWRRRLAVWAAVVLVLAGAIVVGGRLLWVDLPRAMSSESTEQPGADTSRDDRVNTVPVAIPKTDCWVGAHAIAFRQNSSATRH